MTFNIYHICRVKNLDHIPLHVYVLCTIQQLFFSMCQYLFYFTHNTVKYCPSKVNLQGLILLICARDVTQMTSEIKTNDITFNVTTTLHTILLRHYIQCYYDITYNVTFHYFFHIQNEKRLKRGKERQNEFKNVEQDKFLKN